MIPDGTFHSKTGKPRYVFVKDADSDSFLHSRENGAVIIPCGKCYGCRLDYSRRWADRMMLELETAGKGIFVTLTYDNDHVPVKFDEESGEFVGLQLDKRDCQLFMKNLRRDFDGHDGRDPIKVRFFAAGEYGSQTYRPHMHLIIFGLGLDDFAIKIPYGKNELGQKYYTLPELEKCWYDFSDDPPSLKGRVLVSDVSWETCAYVARYVLKKAAGFDAEALDLTPEFTLMSRRPGIGAQYLEEHPDCLDYENIVIETQSGSKRIQIPKYFLNKLKSKAELLPTDLRLKEKYDNLMERRKAMADDSMFRKAMKTTLTYLDQLELDEQKKIRSIAALKRGDCE